MPRAHMRQTVTNHKIYKKHGLEPLWGVWQSVAYNYKRAATLRHRDSTNTTRVPCILLVTELADLKKGGQLVLEELRLVLELAPGDIVIFPSTLITHWNLGLGEGQIRSSLAAWCSAANEMWADQDCEARVDSSARPQQDPTEVLTTYT